MGRKVGAAVPNQRPNGLELPDRPRTTPCPGQNPSSQALSVGGWQVRRSVPNRHPRPPAPSLTGAGCEEKALSIVFASTTRGRPRGLSPSPRPPHGALQRVQGTAIPGTELQTAARPPGNRCYRCSRAHEMRLCSWCRLEYTPPTTIFRGASQSPEASHTREARRHTL